MSILLDSSGRLRFSNPVLLDEQIGHETDTGREKIGDGVTAWNDLSYTPKTDGSPLSRLAATLFSPWKVIALDPDTPGLTIQAFDIVAVDTDAGTFTIDGEYADLFPETAAFAVKDSTGNDGDYAVESVEIVSGQTVVTPVSPPTDDTADGSLFNCGTAGVEIAPAGSYLGTAGLLVTEEFDGSENPAFTLGVRDITATSAPAGVAEDLWQFYGNALGFQGWDSENGGVLFDAGSPALEAPLVVLLTDDNYNDRSLSATQGKAKVLLFAVTPS